MADTIVTCAKNGSAVMRHIVKRIKLSALGGNAAMGAAKRRCWYIADADPAVAAASYAEAPVLVGDFAYRVDSDEAFICTVKPTATTAATFVQLNA